MPSFELKKLLYRYDEVAELLSLSKHTIIGLCEDGQLERIYVANREPRVTRQSILAYIEKRKAGSSSGLHPS